MNTVRPTHLEALHQRADRDGWWVEIEAARGRLARLQVRHKAAPDRLLFVQLAGRNVHVQAAAAALLRALDARGRGGR